MVVADVGEGGDVEIAGAHAFLHQRVRGGLDDRARRASLDHARQPRLHLRSLGRRLARDVVDLAAAHLEGDGAHRPGDDAARLQNVLGHVRDRGLAVRPGDARELEPA